MEAGGARLTGPHDYAGRTRRGGFWIMLLAGRRGDQGHSSLARSR
jgi:hypothetical protein